jgi:tetratricopeptide (TPR) repeat protein
MNKPEEAARSLHSAVQLKSINPRVYFNYGILLQHQNKNDSAVMIYKKGLQISPLDASLNYALALLLVQSGKSGQAKEPASVLKKYYPDAKDYQQLFQYLKL